MSAQPRILPSLMAAMSLLMASCGAEGLQARIELKVEPSEVPGFFRLFGKTTLPPGSEIRVDALRYLDYPGQPPSQPLFSVLTQQVVRVDFQGEWKVLLNTAPNGMEGWQLSFATQNPPVKPLGKDIIFRATWLPENQPEAIQALIGAQGQRLRGLQLLNTGSSQYIRANLPIPALPPSFSSARPTPNPFGRLRQQFYFDDPRIRIPTPRPSPRPSPVPKSGARP